MRAGNGSYSVRPLSTVTPLARELGITVNHEFGKGDIGPLLAALETVSDPVLVCWSHETIPVIIRGVAGELPGLLAKWPGKRFDIVWILDRDGGYQPMPPLPVPYHACRGCPFAARSRQAG
jgi:hypothetical protein